MALVGLVHTTRLVVEPVHQALSQGCPGFQFNHVLDEGILRRLSESGKITPDIVRWLADMVSSAQRAGAGCVVVSCSSLSPCVGKVSEMMEVPVIKVDEPMMEYALNRATDIGLVMTNPTTEAPSTQLFKAVADRLGSRATLVPRLVPNAFDLLSRGDVESHDRAVVQTVTELLEQVDLVMLAQISIARVKKHFQPSLRDRVLSSLDFIAAKVSSVLDAQTESSESKQNSR